MLITTDVIAEVILMPILSEKSSDGFLASLIRLESGSTAEPVIAAASLFDTPVFSSAALVSLTFKTDTPSPLVGEEPQLPLQDGASDAGSVRSEGEPNVMPNDDVFEAVAPSMDLEDATAIDEPTEEHVSEP